MLTIDKESIVWVAQDGSPNVLRIDSAIEGPGVKTQIKIPFPTSQVKVSKEATVVRDRHIHSQKSAVCESSSA